MWLASYIWFVHIESMSHTWVTWQWLLCWQTTQLQARCTMCDLQASLAVSTLGSAPGSNISRLFNTCKWLYMAQRVGQVWPPQRRFSRQQKQLGVIHLFMQQIHSALLPFISNARICSPKHHRGKGPAGTDPWAWWMDVVQTHHSMPRCVTSACKQWGFLGHHASGSTKRRWRNRTRITHRQHEENVGWLRSWGYQCQLSILILLLRFNEDNFKI